MSARSLALNLLTAMMLASAPSVAQDQRSESTFEAAANAALQVWDTQGKVACEAKQPACKPMAGVLSEAAAAFESAHRLDRAMAVRTILLEPRYHLDDTPPGLQAAFDLADNHRAIGDYDLAASLYEDAARKAPKMSAAPEALKQATALRLGLGQLDQAAQDVEQFEKFYGGKLAHEALGLMLAMVAAFIEHEQFKHAKSRLTARMAQIDRAGRIDEQILAHTWLARSLVRLGDAAGGAREYERVRALWQQPQAVMRAIDPKAEDPRRLGNVLLAVGEALFFFAEQKRAEVDAIRFPLLRGPASRERVQRHTNTKIADWVKRKREAIALAETEYLKITRIEPLPPPRWMIASSARVGQLWAGFIAEFRAAPIPDEWKGKGTLPGTTMIKADLRKIYFRTLDDALEPQQQQTKEAFLMCLQISVKMQYFDSYAQMCSDWLSEHYPNEVPAIRELMPPGWKLALPLPPSPVVPGDPDSTERSPASK